MKFEAIDPFNPSHVCVVTVIKVLKFNYFVLGVDSLATYFVCHANSINVFPCGWAKAHDLQLHPPRGGYEQTKGRTDGRRDGRTNEVANKSNCTYMYRKLFYGMVLPCLPISERSSFCCSKIEKTRLIFRLLHDCMKEFFSQS